jgi:hypothetical protein
LPVAVGVLRRPAITSAAGHADLDDHGDPDSHGDLDGQDGHGDPDGHGDLNAGW